LSWFLQEQQCKNHANPSLRSGQALKVKPMLGSRLRRMKKISKVNVYLFLMKIKEIQMELWRIYLPYCLRKLKSGNWIFLNRKYKPIGIDCADRIDYEKSDTIFKFRRDPVIRLQKYSVNIINSDEGETYFFFDDSCLPYSNKPSTIKYFDRMKEIMSLSRCDQ
jgi:hypothetical protein